MNIDSLPIWVHFAATFGCMFALDVIWVFYTKAVVAKAPGRAAGWCALLTMANAVAAVLYVKNPWLIIPAVAGAFAGTFVAMRLDKPEKEVRTAPAADGAVVYQRGLSNFDGWIGGRERWYCRAHDMIHWGADRCPGCVAEGREAIASP